MWVLPQPLGVRWSLASGFESLLGLPRGEACETGGLIFVCGYPVELGLPLVLEMCGAWQCHLISFSIIGLSCFSGLCSGGAGVAFNVRDVPTLDSPRRQL